MRNVFSRRDFLKASAAAVLAASAAGVLTGCDGGGSEIPSATIGLGEFEVTMTGNMTVTGDEVVAMRTPTATSANPMCGFGTTVQPARSNTVLPESLRQKLIRPRWN